ncbi:hypothetical protein J437_LFUL011971 [Ladona fulva]|uniref:DDE-1 domain-containing protein n=1 Tax=Ladona fulva TaxID=123851 RepID=A0A8K0KC75_LADFU|nr:hypothetical protein J437_LFUL011971 [Ladona fulva]
MIVRAASTRCAVPKNTLGDRVKNLLERKEETAKPCCSDNKGTFSRTFDRDREEILYNHVSALDSQLMPLSKPEFLKLAEKLKIEHRFNKETSMVGKDFYVFMNRHPDLRLRTAESTSLQRAVGFSKDKVNIFFDKLTEHMEKYKFNPSRILINADETGVSCVHNNRLKVMSVKGKKQVGKLTSGERIRNVTVLLSINAAGDQFIPPLFVFSRVRIVDDLKKDAPPGSTFDAQMNEWITKDGFLKWMKAFFERVNTTEKSPVQDRTGQSR